MSKSSFTLAAVGDCATGLEPTETLFDYVVDHLREADIRFAQNERLYSERGTFQEQGLAPHVRQHPRMAQAFKHVPFDVVGVGSNHIGEFGPDAAIDTLETFHNLGIKTVAAGRTIADARTPAIIESNGFKIAFIGYVSVLLPQFWATETRAGGTPMRAHSLYEPYEYQPGAPARPVTVPFAEDLKNLEEDIRKAKEKADFVVVSLHWGVHFISKPLADYQIAVAHAAIDAGASLILGHHPHVMQAIEQYKGGLIFYSLGNFAFFRRGGHENSPNFLCPQGAYEFKDVYSFEPDPGEVYHWHRHWSEGFIAEVTFDKDGISQASIVPTLMNEKAQPRILAPDSDEFKKFMTYASWVSDSVEGGLVDLRQEGDRIRIYER